MPEGEEGRGCGRGRYRGGSCCLGSRIGEEVPLRVPRFCDECFLFFLYNEEVERERRGGNDDLLCVCVCAFHNDPGSLRSPFPAHTLPCLKSSWKSRKSFSEVITSYHVRQAQGENRV